MGVRGFYLSEEKKSHASSVSIESESSSNVPLHEIDKKTLR